MAYEIEARARWGLGQRRRALEIISDGARRHPSLYILWEYFGEFASDLGHYDDATAAFMRAGETGMSPCSVDYNLGVIAFRRNRLQEAADYYRSALAVYNPDCDSAFTPSLLHAEAAYVLAKLGNSEAVREHLGQVDVSALPPDAVERIEEARALIRA